MIMDIITPHMEMRTLFIIYSFKSEIYRRFGVIMDYSKTLKSLPGIFTSLKEIQAYVEDCKQKRLDLENEEVWSKTYLPATKTTETRGSYEDKVLLRYIQIRLLAYDEPLMGCEPL